MNGMYYELYRQNAEVKRLVDGYIARHKLEVLLDAENKFIDLYVGTILTAILKKIEVWENG